MEQILNSRYVIILGRREYTQRKVKKNPSFGAAVCAAASDRKGTERASRVRVRRSEDANSCCVVLPGRGQMVNPHVKTAAPLSSAVRCPPTRRRDPFFNHSPVAFSGCCCLLGSVWSLARSLATKPHSTEQTRRKGNRTISRLPLVSDGPRAPIYRLS